MFIVMQDWRPSLMMSSDMIRRCAYHWQTSSYPDYLCDDNRAHAFAMNGSLHDAQHTIHVVNQVFVSIKPLSQTKML